MFPQSGFLKSGRKIVLHFSAPNQRINSQPSHTSAWICPSCSMGNTITLSRCQLCGAKQPETSAISPTLQTNLCGSPNGSLDSIERPCPHCTYMNRETLDRCEMCQVDLATTYQSDGSSTDEMFQRSASTGDQIRIAFKKGGSTVFYDKLQVAISMKTWEVSIIFWFQTFCLFNPKSKKILVLIRSLFFYK